MVNLISSLLEELPLAVGSEEIARVPSTLRDQSDQVAAEESSTAHQKSASWQRTLFERGHRRKSLGIEITMLEQAQVIVSPKCIGLEKFLG